MKCVSSLQECLSEENEWYNSRLKHKVFFLVFSSLICLLISMIINIVVCISIVILCNKKRSLNLFIFIIFVQQLSYFLVNLERYIIDIDKYLHDFFSIV